MIETLRNFEEKNNVDKISLKEISERYKAFNLKRNMRLKNRLKS